jgi:hypothetical protein
MMAVRTQIKQGHSPWVYFLPIVHFSACCVCLLGLIFPGLQYLGIMWGFIMLLDLPVSVVAYVLAFRGNEGANVWIFVAGTLWWYFLSCGVEMAFKRLSDRKSDSWKLTG